MQRTAELALAELQKCEENDPQAPRLANLVNDFNTKEQNVVNQENYAIIYQNEN